MPETKTERRPAAEKQAAARRRRVAHGSNALARSQSGPGMSYGFVDRMMELNKTGELRSPVSQTLESRR